MDTALLIFICGLLWSANDQLAAILKELRNEDKGD